MDQNVIDKLKNAVTSKLSGQSDLRRNVIKNIEKGEQKESEEEQKHYLSFLKDKKDIYALEQKKNQQIILIKIKNF